MIAQLSELSQAASPTSFHRVLRALDDRGKLLRVYTQNIDAIESKCGLSFGVPEFDDRRKPRLKGKAATPTDESAAASQPPLSRMPSPPDETPRCIPLHGTLQTLHCQTCTHIFPLEDHLPSLTSGMPPYCPQCTAMEQTRQLIGKRARGVGKLRPSVVLYNELHKDGEGVGEVVRKDLVGVSKGKGRSGADLLLVVGTSLRVPGTKRIVREFAKAVHSRTSTTTTREGSTSSIGLTTPNPSPRRTPASDEEPSLKAVYLNLDFPVPTREWDGVFDAWVQGDAQSFAELLGQEIEKEARAKEVAVEKKRKREEEVEQEVASSKGDKKQKVTSEISVEISDSNSVVLPPTPTSARRKHKVESTFVTKAKLKPSTARKGKQTSTVKVTTPRARPRSTSSRIIPVTDVHITTCSSRITKPEPLDRQADLSKELGGRWKRGPLILPGHSEVPPIVDQMDDYRSFKMFDAGWILPDSQKRGGRAAITRTPPMPPKRRTGPAKVTIVSSALTAHAHLEGSLTTDTEDTDVAIMDEEFTEEAGQLPVTFHWTDTD